LFPRNTVIIVSDSSRVYNFNFYNVSYIKNGKQTATCVVRSIDEALAIEIRWKEAAIELWNNNQIERHPAPSLEKEEKPQANAKVTKKSRYIVTSIIVEVNG